MLQDLDLTNVLVLDIETVSGKKTFEELDETMQGLWEIKSKQVQRTEPKLEAAENYPNMAGIYSEFGKIICISVGMFRKNLQTGQLDFHVKSFYDHNERKLLTDFADLITRHFGDPRKHVLCGHNVKEFDIPYICRRMVINRMVLPLMLDLSGKKPWETKQLLDTMDLWKFGDSKSFTSLKLLCGLFGIPTPKDDIDGSEVGRVYWEDGDLERIQVYCRKDVVATAQVLLSFMLRPTLAPEQVHYR